jgi:arylsulfatase A-like enzyme
VNTQTRRASLRRRTALALCAALVSTTVLMARPNIVVIYMDDVAPHDGRLWNDPARTPAIYDTFVEHGIRFSNAYGEVPLCCPARGNFLTGLHSHNNGLTTNDARLYSAKESVAGELKAAGYTTMWIGKYMNRTRMLSAADWDAHLAPWSVFDGIYSNNADYNDYDLRTKDGPVVHYDDYHSTQMVTDRAPMRFAAAPADKPIFAMLSIYSLHGPNIPVPQPQEKYDMCTGLAPWWTPAYNEADVSDKPAYIQARPLLANPNGWRLEGYCREMFGIDALVKSVTDELEAEGRLDNTLLMFTADNGMGWGAHRWPQMKVVPFATQVPLYMTWPDRWGTTPRVVSEYVSNIDFAPTFCAIGGCALGPYATGQSAPDGVSLLNLIDNGTPLGRDALLESALLGDYTKNLPAWAAVRTTPLNPLGLWHYVEYVSGERELYNLTNDPYELENLAGRPAQASVQAALAQRLRQLLNEGRVNRPDASLWGAQVNKDYAGYQLFDSTLTARQTLTVSMKPAQTYKVRLQVHNNALAGDSFTIRATTDSAKTTMRFVLDGVDVTSQITSGGLVLSSLGGDKSRWIGVYVTTKRRFPVGTRVTIEIDVESNSIPSRDDHVAFVVKR